MHKYKTHLTVLFAFAFAMLTVCNSTSSANEKNKHTVTKNNQLSCEFISVELKPGESPDKLDNNGIIQIKNIAGKIIYKEFTMISPTSSDDFPTISKIQISPQTERMLGGDTDIYVVYGNIDGHHNTLKLFHRGPNGLRTTSIDFENAHPNLTKSDNDNTYTAKIGRRLLFSDLGYPNIKYLFIYNLHTDSSTFGFELAQGAEYADQYLEYYKSLRNYLNNKNYNICLGPMLASLTSTQDKNTICNELDKIEKSLKQSVDTNYWNSKLISAGYPGFNFKENCRRY